MNGIEIMTDRMCVISDEIKSKITNLYNKNNKKVVLGVECEKIYDGYVIKNVMIYDKKVEHVKKTFGEEYFDDLNELFDTLSNCQKIYNKTFRGTDKLIELKKQTYNIEEIYTENELDSQEDQKIKEDMKKRNTIIEKDKDDQIILCQDKNYNQVRMCLTVDKCTRRVSVRIFPYMWSDERKCYEKCKEFIIKKNDIIKYSDKLKDYILELDAFYTDDDAEVACSVAWYVVKFKTIKVAYETDRDELTADEILEDIQKYMLKYPNSPEIFSYYIKGEPTVGIWASMFREFFSNRYPNNKQKEFLNGVGNKIKSGDSRKGYQYKVSSSKAIDGDDKIYRIMFDLDVRKEIVRKAEISRTNNAA